MSQRQTLSYLQRRFDRARLQPQTKYGQNFLIDLNLVEWIASAADLDGRDVVLEVGTGMGSLTAQMAARAGHVVTVEIDRRLAKYARDEFHSIDNVTLLEEDALKTKNRLNPNVIQTLQRVLAEHPRARLKLVANLPYNVATPILSNLLDFDPWPKLMVATIQKELAHRITARPGSRDYSALSVWMQAQCKCEILRTLPPTVFWPQPKVDSAILKIQPQRILRKRIGDCEFFHLFVRSIFLHRRKFLRSALQFAAEQSVQSTSREAYHKGPRRKPKLEIPKPAIDDILHSFGIDGRVRAEQLTPQQLIELAESVRENFQPMHSGS